MAKTKSIPMRTCIACREVKPKKEMLRVVRTTEGEILADHGGDVLFKKGEELILDPAVNEQIIRRNAGLAAVEQLAKGQTLGGQIELDRRIHDTGTLAAEFQNSRGEMLCRTAKHFFAYSLTSRKKHEIEFLLQSASASNSGRSPSK